LSWDVLIYDFKGPPVSFDNLPRDYKPPDMGSASEVREKISAYLPGVDWSDPAWGTYLGDGFVIEFNMGRHEIIDCIMLHVRGGGDAISAMMQFVAPNRWSALDCSDGEFLDPANPSQSGWLGFQAYRDKVSGREPSQ
jgi:hypothetical protein